MSIVKQVCKELKLTYRQLGEIIGYEEKSLNVIASTGKISEPIKKALKLLIENEKLKKQLVKENKNIEEKQDINIVKTTCKDLDITQKELAQIMSIHEETISKWSRGAVETPKWALKHFKLLKIEKKYNLIKQLTTDKL